MCKQTKTVSLQNEEIHAFLRSFCGAKCLSADLSENIIQTSISSLSKVSNFNCVGYLTSDRLIGRVLWASLDKLWERNNQNAPNRNNCAASILSLSKERPAKGRHPAVGERYWKGISHQPLKVTVPRSIVKIYLFFCSWSDPDTKCLMIAIWYTVAVLTSSRPTFKLLIPKQPCLTEEFHFWKNAHIQAVRWHIFIQECK